MLDNQQFAELMQPVSNNKIAYRRDIDGLRTIAVLSVIAFHAFPARFRGGFVGVDVFFVISGFLISSIIYNELRSDTFSIVEFYIRRVRRIYPALLLVLISVGLAGWFILLPTDLIALGKQIIGGSAFVANFVLWGESGYFSPDASLKPLLHLWSLGIEEQFYLIFPLLCILFYRSKSRWTLPTAFLVVAGTSMFVNTAFVSRYSAACFFLPISRFWELFIGAGLALCVQRNLQFPLEGRLFERWRECAGFLGLALILISVFAIDQLDAFPGWWALLPTTGAALIITAGPACWPNRCILSSKPAVFVGLISYPLYLWHWPILSFMKNASATWGVNFSHAQKGAALALAFPLSYVTYRFVEQPIRRVKQKRQRRQGALWLLGSVSLIGTCGALIVFRAGFPARLPSDVVAFDHNYGSDESTAWREGTCFLRPDQTASSFGDNCVDPRRGMPQPIVFIWGDSHAADLYPGFRVLQQQSGVRLAEYTSSSCPPILGLRIRTRPACLNVNNAVFQRVRSMRPEIVVLSAFWDDPDPDHDPDTRAQKLVQTLEAIKAAGVQRVVVIGSVPVWTEPVPGLLIGALQRNPGRPITARLSRSLVKTHDDTVLRAAAQKAGAIYVPLFEHLCDQKSCIATTGPDWKEVVISDNTHFTEHGSLLVARQIWPSIVPPADLDQKQQTDLKYPDSAGKNVL